MDTRPETLSIIIPTRNSSRFLRECLRSLETAIIRTETIVVDTLSSDDSRSIASQFKARVISTAANRSEARNIGFRQSTGELLLFLDSDMVVAEGLLEECLSKAHKCEALVIPEVSEGTGYWAKCKALERALDGSRFSLEACRFFRRPTFEKLGGYDEALAAGEDWDLHFRTMRTGLIVGRTSRRITHLEGSLTIAGLFRKKYKYGHFIKQYLRKYPAAVVHQLNPFQRVIFAGVAASRKDPRHGIGVFLLKMVEFIAAAIGFAASAFRQGSEK